MNVLYSGFINSFPFYFKDNGTITSVNILNNGLKCRPDRLPDRLFQLLLVVKDM